MYLLTGAAGFLGQHVARALSERGLSLRALVLPGDPLAGLLPQGVAVYQGDLLSDADLDRFFAGAGPGDTLIHCASLITMSMEREDKVTRVNVDGTLNLVERCLKTGARMLHVTSVHAIEEAPHGQVMREPQRLDPEPLVGWYAKTKAMAARLVMTAREQQGLQASIVYPAGLAGPGDHAGGNLTQMFYDYQSGALTLGVAGGYNFADVRDVAQAIATLAQTEALGEDYVLSGEYISIVDILGEFSRVTGRPPVTRLVPRWLARAFLPLIRLMYKIRRVKPVFSAYSLYTVQANCLFDHAKASADLGYAPRPIRETLGDTARWLMARQRQGPPR